MRKWLIAGIGAVVLAATVTGGAIAFASNDGEGGVSGPQADRAIQAALEATGGGTANAVERDGESGGVWEVEVSKTDGSIVDVRLDENFHVVVIDGDRETADTNDGSS
jgi:predicted regulator of Ras-like GTPase activity (Roadblock/LC7/MglB family)